MRPCLEKHHGRVLSSFSEVVNKSIPFWDKLAEIDREGWAARARVEKKSDHYIYIRKAREKGCGEREVLSLQLSDCESDPDELPGQICDVQQIRHRKKKFPIIIKIPCPSKTKKGSCLDPELPHKRLHRIGLKFCTTGPLQIAVFAMTKKQPGVEVCLLVTFPLSFRDKLTIIGT
ncbi:unnamed protein product, partial [Cylicostephanus goldi]